MEPAFVDAAGWIALFNRSDSLHTRAVAVRKTLYEKRTPLLTSEFVLMEVADALSSPAIRVMTAELIHGLKREALLRIIPASTELFTEGLDLFGRRADKAWSLTDCTSFVLMTKERINVVFTSDHHFEQAGFRILL